MKYILLIPVLLLSIALTLAGCEKKEEPPKSKEVTKDQVKEQAGKLLDTARDFLQQQKDKFLQDFDGRLQGFNKKIDELQKEMETATPEMQAKLKTALGKLKEKQEVIKKQLEESKGAAGKAWEDLKSGLDETLKQMDQELEKDRNQKQI
jgi:TolA-binding protein